MAGRPTIYTDALADEICEALSNGVKGYVSLYKENPHWPMRSTINAWRLSNKVFSDKYDAAKTLQLENMQEEMLEISAKDALDVIEQPDGKQSGMPVRVQRHRLIVETMRWNLERLAPKKYAQQTSLVINPEGCLKLYDASVTTIPGNDE